MAAIIPWEPPKRRVVPGVFICLHHFLLTLGAWFPFGASFPMRPIYETMKDTDWFYGTQRWKDTRKAYKKARGGLCERCLKAGLIRAGEFVHHKVYLDAENINDPSVTLNFDNLELLCRDCHAAEHSRRRFAIDEDGYVHA